MQAFELTILNWIQAHLRCGVLDAGMVPVSRICDHGEVWILLAAILLAIPKTRKRSFINNGTQHNQHFVSARRAYHFFHLRCKSRNDIAITILNAGNEQWSHPDSFIGKSRVCADHFTDRNFTRSQTK